MSNDVTEPRQEYTDLLPSVTKNRAANDVAWAIQGFT